MNTKIGLRHLILIPRTLQLVVKSHPKCGELHDRPKTLTNSTDVKYSFERKPLCLGIPWPHCLGQRNPRAGVVGCRKNVFGAIVESVCELVLADYSPCV